MNSVRQEACARGHPDGRSASLAMLEMTKSAEHAGCFMCGAENPRGINLAFQVQGDGSVVATFSCAEVFQGYPATLHGGIVTAVLDAAMTNALFSFGLVVVTAELTVRFLAPVSLGRGAVVRASLERATHRSLYYVRAELEQDHTLMARAAGKFLVKGRT